jgi:hypothetical protein
MNELIKLAPLAVGLVVFAVVVGFMLQRGMALGTWLLAAFLLGHGLVHVMFVAPPPTDPASPAADFAFNASRSWIVTGNLVSLSAVQVLVTALVAVTVLGYGLAALATLGLVVPTTMWTTFLVAGTAASAALMVIGLAPALALGIAIDVALVAIVFFTTWRPAALTA